MRTADDTADIKFLRGTLKILDQFTLKTLVEIFVRNFFSEFQHLEVSAIGIYNITLHI